MLKNENEPRQDDCAVSLICGARLKNSNGRLCISLVVHDKRRCHIHGGAKGSGAQDGNQNALKHGYTTQKAKCLRKAIRLAMHEADAMISSLSD